MLVRRCLPKLAIALNILSGFLESLLRSQTRHPQGRQSQRTPHKMNEDLETNRTAAAELRESEAELVRRPIPLLDLRTVPRERWDSMLDRELVVPPTIASLLPDVEYPISGEQADAFADGIAMFYGIAPPYYVEMSIRFQQTGRAWAYVPEAAPYVSGFYFSKEVP
jgi:hypothetical protein